MNDDEADMLMTPIHQSELTRWYPMTTDPVRVGVYQVRTRFGVFYSLWTGAQWMTGFAGWRDAAAIRWAATATDSKWGVVRLGWRGLASPPEVER